MNYRRQHSVTQAAAKAGISRASGYRIESDSSMPSQRENTRASRRPDPLEGLFEEEVVPILINTPGIRPVAIYEELLRRHPTLSTGIRRTLERRVRQWQVLHGPEQELIFRQTHEPGRLGLSDFTDMGEFQILVEAQPLVHRLYHFRLAYSGFSHAHVVLGGESFIALAEGLQNALWSLGGVPVEHRTDSLTAAFCNRDSDTQEDLTRRYELLCQHYGMSPSRNNRGEAHENGSIEGPHGHLKRAIKDALLLRGSSCFDSLEAYRRFIDQVVGRLNVRHAGRIDTERAVLCALPAQRSDDFEQHSVRVTSGGGFVLKKVFYSVPSRLVGHRLRVHLYDDHLELFAGNGALESLPRGRCDAKGNRCYVVNYRHVIHSLRRKPMALRSLVYRDQIFPRLAYRQMYERLLESSGERVACKTMVELLAMAHEQSCEGQMAAVLQVMLQAGELACVDEMRERFAPSPEHLPSVSVELPPLAQYDSLLGSLFEARVSLLLKELRLPAMSALWSEFAARSDTEGWPAARFLAALAEHEVAERDRRRIARHLSGANLLPGKTLDSFDFTHVPMISKAQVQALAEGDDWIEQGNNVLVFGPPGGGKSHLSSALGLSLVERGWRVLFARTTDLVQKLQIARQELQLENAIRKLDKYHLLILDDLAYVVKDQAETSVLFELISARYEHRSLLVTANQPFGEWNKVFQDPAMTLAAVDRLVHHSVILEMNVESYRQRSAKSKQIRRTGRPTKRATRHNTPSD
ncbi:unnamed protein product, partial [Cyprideis torosa]